MNNESASIVSSNASNCRMISSYLRAKRYLYKDEPCLFPVIIMLYAIIAIVGAIGNSMVVAAVVRCQQMRTVRNYFIALLAVSDFFVSTVTLPFSVRVYTIYFWHLGDGMCRIVSCIQTFNIFVSTMTMAAISADRYVVIVFPTKFKAQKFVVFICGVVICITATVMSVPAFLSAGIYKAWEDLPPVAQAVIEDICQHEKLWVCSEGLHQFISPMGNLIYSIFVLLFQYLIPLLSLIFLNQQITRRLARRPIPNRSQGRAEYHSVTSVAYNRRDEIGSPVPGSEHGSARLKRSAARAFSHTGASLKRFVSRLQSEDLPEGMRRQIRIKRIMVSVVLTFAIVWLPFNLYGLIVAFGLVGYNVKIQLWCHLVAMLSICANPIIYGALNENFRAEFSKIIRQLHPSCNNFDGLNSQPVNLKLQTGVVIPLVEREEKSHADACVSTHDNDETEAANGREQLALCDGDSEHV